MDTPPELRVGTSGWNYSDWRGRFYPEEVASSEYLRYYAGGFDTVEVNYSFYHLPRPATYRKWAEQTPDGFVFAVKASRYITHIKRLKGIEKEWSTFLENAAALGKKLGPILLQLPPSSRADFRALSRFLKMRRPLPEVKLAFEFRHASWFDPEILEALRQSRAGLVIANSERYPQAPCVPTADFVYLRFHGPGQLFASAYSNADLEPWARRVRDWLAAGRIVYAYFNNDFHAHAIANARTLLRTSVSG